MLSREQIRNVLVQICEQTCVSDKIKDYIRKKGVSSEEAASVFVDSFLTDALVARINHSMSEVSFMEEPDDSDSDIGDSRMACYLGCLAGKDRIVNFNGYKVLNYMTYLTQDGEILLLKGFDVYDVYDKHRFFLGSPAQDMRMTSLSEIVPEIYASVFRI